MHRQYNLTTENWIPVKWQDKSYSEIGIAQLLYHAEKIEEITTDNPLETCSLNRMIAALVASIFPEISKTEKWFQLWHQGAFDKEHIDRYLDEHRDKFDLLSPTMPFYGHHQPDTNKVSPLSRLYHAESSGGNAMLFDHHMDDDPQSKPLSEIAMAIVCTQNYALGGGVAKPFNLSHAPLINGSVLWLKGVQGDTYSLFKALLLNLAPSKQVWGGNPVEDKPAWEHDLPPAPEKRIPKGIKDLFTFQSRRLEIVNEGNIATGVYYNQGSKIEGGFQDPHMSYRQGKDGMFPVNPSLQQSLWRYMPYFMMTHSRKEEGHAPGTFQWVSEQNNRTRMGVDEKQFSADIFGIINDKAKVEMWYQRRLVIYPEIMSSEKRWQMLNQIVEIAEEFNKENLRQASRAFATRYRLKKSYTERLGDIERADRNAFASSLAVEGSYWMKLEFKFNEYITKIAQQPVDELDQIPQQWRRQVWGTARQCFDNAIASFTQTATGQRAMVEAHYVLVSNTGNFKKSFL